MYLLEDDLGEVPVVRHLAVGEDIGLSPTRVSLPHPVYPADGSECVLRVTRLHRDEDVRRRCHDAMSVALEAVYHCFVARVLIDGPPASGKSTIASRTVHILREHGEQPYGFTTAEIRRGGRRTGFTVAGIASGLERILAVRGGNGPRVGSYGIDLAAFEEIALNEIDTGLELGATLVVDEIGKMELLSDAFARLVEPIFASPRLLATAQRPADPRIGQVIARTEMRRIGLPRSNRDELPALVASWILEDGLVGRTAL